MKEIREKMAKLLEEIRGFATKSSLTDEEKQQLQRMNKDYDDLSTKRDLMEKIENEERRLAGQESEEPETEKRDFSKDEQQRSTFRKFMMGASPENLDADEAEFMKKRARTFDTRGAFGTDKRAQTVTTTGGGYLVPTSLSKEIEKQMADFARVINIARVIRDNSGNPFTWPTINDTTNKGRLLSINTQVTTTDFAFGLVTFGAYKFSSDQVLVPWELAISSGVELDDLIKELLSERVGRIFADYTIDGTGTSQPEGIEACTLGATATDPTALAYADLVSLLHSVDPAYRVPTCKWAFNDATLALIRVMKDGNNQYIFKNGAGAMDETILGYKYEIIQGMADVAADAKSVMFGDWRGYVVRLVQDQRMRVLLERYADYDQIGYFLLQSMDARWINKNKVKHLLQPTT